jgi:predicted DNA binding CopG/RHH family protein
MSEKIDSLIERKEAELLPLRSRMEELRGQFTKETVDFASKWYRKTAKDYITKYPEVTLSMSEEKIAAMKDRTNELVKSAERLVKAEFDNAALWWHLEPHLHDSIDRYLQVADKYPEVLDRAVRRVLGHLGVVLEKFGFPVTASGYTGTYHEFWFEHPVVGTREIVPCYPHLLSWTDEMQGIIRQYNALYVEAIGLYNNIQRLKEEKKRQEALTRWDFT